jgi:flagellar hook assembly protein FlgD
LNSDGTVVAVAIPWATFALHQNHPNPFNPSTTIRFTLAAREHTSIVVYDAKGRRVRTLVDAAQDAGEHEVEWDGRDANGVVVSSGVYFCRLSAGIQSETRKMVLLK